MRSAHICSAGGHTIKMCPFRRDLASQWPESGQKPPESAPRQPFPDRYSHLLTNATTLGGICEV
jgi:hypothetical protein